MTFALGRLFVCAIAVTTAGSRAGSAAANPRNPSAAGSNRTKNEAAIRETVESLVQAIRARNVDQVLSSFAPDVVSFDVGPPLQHGGGEEFRKRWRELFESYRGPIEYEVHGLAVVAGEDVAFSHSLNRIGGTLKNGQKTDRWLRWTACYRKIAGEWRIVHEQVSVLVDMRSGKAFLDLQP